MSDTDVLVEPSPPVIDIAAAESVAVLSEELPESGAADAVSSEEAAPADDSKASIGVAHLHVQQSQSEAKSKAKAKSVAVASPKNKQTATGKKGGVEHKEAVKPVASPRRVVSVLTSPRESKEQVPYKSVLLMIVFEHDSCSH